MEERAPQADEPVPSDDDVLREQSFRRATGLNLGSFLLEESDGAVAEEAATAVPSNVDAAVGEVSELFSLSPAEQTTGDTAQHLAVHGEQQLGKGLAVAMV